jgi:hypothetical protein
MATTLYYICPQCKKVRSTTFPKMKPNPNRGSGILFASCSGKIGCGWAGRTKSYPKRPS